MPAIAPGSHGVSSAFKLIAAPARTFSLRSQLPWSFFVTTIRYSPGCSLNVEGVFPEKIPLTSMSAPLGSEVTVTSDAVAKDAEAAWTGVAAALSLTPDRWDRILMK